MTTRFFYGTQTARDSLGAEYVNFTYIGPVEQGTPKPIGHATEADAWRAYFAALNTFIEEKSATMIEWRVPPTMEKAAAGRFIVYSRLSVIEGVLSPIRANQKDAA